MKLDIEVLNRNFAIEFKDNLIKYTENEIFY